MKGHMENGKFHPHTEYKGIRKSRDQQVKQAGVVIRKARRRENTNAELLKKFSAQDIEGGQNFYDNNICEGTQEWIQILGDKYPIKDKYLFGHNSCGWTVWDKEDLDKFTKKSKDEWDNVHALSLTDKESIIRFWIDEKKDVELEDKRIRDRDDRIEEKSRKELSEATGVEIPEIFGSHNAFQKFRVEQVGFEGEFKITTVLPFSVTPDKLKDIENNGYKIVSVGSGIQVEKIAKEAMLI